MIKIIVASDNHGDLDSINLILSKNHNADYYLHLGDSCCEPSEINPFSSVKGNNDYNTFYPEYKIIEVAKNIRFFMVHGHQYTFNIAKLVEKAKSENCNVVLYGHTHVFTDYVKDGVRLINPGSCYYNRDRSNPCYAEIIINNSEILVKRVDLDSIY